MDLIERSKRIDSLREWSEAKRGPQGIVEQAADSKCSVVLDKWSIDQYHISVIGTSK